VIFTGGDNLGLTIETKTGHCRVLNVHAGSLSDIEGVRSGDYLLYVQGTTCHRLPFAKVVRELKYNRKLDEMVCHFFRGPRGGDTPYMQAGKYDISECDDDGSEDGKEKLISEMVDPNDIAVMVAAGGMLFAVGNDGDELWAHEFYKSSCQLSLCYRQGAQASSPLAMGAAMDAVFVAGSGHVHAVDIRTGKKLWHKNISKGYPSSENSNMALDDDAKKLYVCQLGTIICCDTENGNTLWKAMCPATGFDQVTVLLNENMGRNSLFVGSRGQVFCFDPSDGTLVWTATMKASVKCYVTLAAYAAPKKSRTHNTIIFGMHGRIGGAANPRYNMF